MYHSITFSDRKGVRNTWDDWHLIPAERPAFTPPEARTNYVEIPGGNGSLDISEALTGYPVFGDRTGEWTFYTDPSFLPWNELYSLIANFLHGRKLRASLEDDPAYYYEGRFSMDAYDAGPDYSEITISYTVAPYKRPVTGDAMYTVEVPETGAEISMKGTLEPNSPKFKMELKNAERVGMYVTFDKDTHFLERDVDYIPSIMFDRDDPTIYIGPNGIVNGTTWGYISSDISEKSPGVKSHVYSVYSDIPYGVSGGLTKMAQSLLSILGKYNGSVDGYWGPMTSAAIKEVNGTDSDTITQATWHSLYSEMPLLYLESTSNESKYVMLVQTILRSKGYYTSGTDIDGVYGTHTRKAVADFQTRQGLGSNGQVYGGTWEYLLDIYYNGGKGVNDYINRLYVDSEGEVDPGEPEVEVDYVLLYRGIEDREESIKKLQDAMKYLDPSYDVTSTEYGVFGPETESMIKRYQATKDDFNSPGTVTILYRRGRL